MLSGKDQSAMCPSIVTSVLTQQCCLTVLIIKHFHSSMELHSQIYEVLPWELQKDIFSFRKNSNYLQSMKLHLLTCFSVMQFSAIYITIGKNHQASTLKAYVKIILLVTASNYHCWLLPPTEWTAWRPQSNKTQVNPSRVWRVSC